MDFKEKYFNLWKRAYDFMKKWFGNHGTPEEWEQIVAEAGEMCKTQNEPFLKDLMLAVISELEREDKRRKKGAGDGG